MGATLLALAAIGLVIPALYHVVASGAVARATLTAAQEALRERDLSFEIAIVLFVAYALSLVFTLGTHRHLYAGTAASTVRHQPDGSRSRAGTWGPALTLLATTVLVAWMSELLVGAVDEASHALGLTPVFVGVVVVAIIGNAAEHSTAVLVAMRDQMDLALNIAVGSSIQIALFVAPVLVFALALPRARPHGPALHALRGGLRRHRRRRGEPGLAGRRVELARGRAAGGGLRHPRPGLLLPAVTRERS